jgi:phosphate starvation-inducible PhoH-like protein
MFEKTKILLIFGKIKFLKQNILYELTYEITGINTKTFYGVNNQFFNLIKSSFPTLKITGRDHFIFAMGNQETLDVFKQKLDDVVNYIFKNNSIELKN